MTTATSTRPMSLDETRAVMDRYLSSGHSDLDVMAPDVVFTVMATGQEFHGPEAVAGMLQFFYHGAFEATTEDERVVIGEGRAVGEWWFVGRHTGEFAGVPATGRDVRVPLAVAYDLAEGQVTAARIYFEIPAFLAQVSDPA
jgi:predicted ester cyclase